MEEVATVEVTSDVTISSTNVAAQTTIITLPSFTYRAVPYLFELYFSALVPGATNTALVLSLFEDSTNVGRVYQQNAWVNATADMRGSTIAARLTPTVGARVFSFRGYRVGGANATIRGGAARTSDGFEPIRASAYQIL